MSKKLACVVVPIYRTTLLPYEEVALRRCTQILDDHDIIVIRPMSLDLRDLSLRYGNLRQESFHDKYFNDVSGYNRLMMLDEFYSRFLEYEYILIHQLDAFVFSNQLSAWCAKGYDYIGAPWLPNRNVPSRWEGARASARRFLSRLTNRKSERNSGVHETQYMFSAGNGGFSLRRVQSMRRALKALPDTVQSYQMAADLFHNEDIFFSVEANRYLNRLRIPRLREAVGFAWERYPEAARAMNHGALPFGCHAWNRWHRDDWRPIFREFGYSIDELLR